MLLQSRETWGGVQSCCFTVQHMWMQESSSEWSAQDISGSETSRGCGPHFQKTGFKSDKRMRVYLLADLHLVTNIWPLI